MSEICSCPDRARLGGDTNSLYRGIFCRCCGGTLTIIPSGWDESRRCARKNRCSWCKRRNCGPHSLRGNSLGMPERRFCEIDGKSCENGKCPDHGFEEASVMGLPHPLDILADDRMPVPGWLANYTPDQKFPLEQFFDSRVVYYPGSGTDGQPLRIWGKSHSAHCFVYVDYGVHQSELHEILSNEHHHRHPRGYRPIHIADLTERDLAPNGWRPHMNALGRRRQGFANATPFALWTVLERKEQFGDDHGPERLSLLNIGGDGFATFDAMFCQSAGREVFGLLLQDHGFGGNWSRFGGESYLYDLASRFVLPQWLLLAENTMPWHGYTCVSSSDSGGMHLHPRRLYRRNDLSEIAMASET